MAIPINIVPKKIELPKQKKVAIQSLPEWAYIKSATGEDIILDAEQIKAVELAIAGESFALIGTAGTGKTTTMQAIFLALLSQHANRIHNIEYRIKGAGTMVPGISIGVVAFANRAANNIRAKAQAHPDLKPIMTYNVTTLHNMLQYSVEFYIDPETGKNKRRYYPKKDEIDKLELTHLVVEESSQVAVGDNSIWDQMYKALPPGVQVIFLGDVNQIPPVGGKPVLAYAMRDLPTIELKTVHRTALDNPIINQAQRCLHGKDIEQEIKEGKGVRVFYPEKMSRKYKGMKIPPYAFRSMLISLLEQQYKLGQYDPMQDIVLMPNAKAADHLVSTHDINAGIATFLAEKYNREVWEIRAGFNTVYVGIGDRVMVDKFEGIVTKISTNGQYIGPTPQAPSTSLTYHGIHNKKEEYNYEALSIDDLIESSANSSGDGEDEGKRAASHILTVELEDGTEKTLSSAGDFGATAFSLGYALTVHKAQGSEWRNVIVALHQSAAMLIYRELLYTAMTRATERVDILAPKSVLSKAVSNPRIKGNTMEDKMEFFNSGYLDLEVPLVPPAEGESE